MAERSLWFESHLFADRAGRRAREACMRLGAPTHEQILLAGDRLAAGSAAVAQQFYRHAAATWEALGADGFARWVDLGQTLLSGEPALRDAALVYFAVAPKAVSAVGLQRLAAWCSIGVRVAAVSRKLGTLFFEGTAPLLDKFTDDLLEEWARQGIRLHGQAGWRGEFLAQAYFGAAAQVLPRLRADELAAWADVGVALQPALRETQFFGSLPPGLAALSAAERARLFATTRAVASVQPAAAAVLYTQLPAALRRLHATRAKVLEVFQRTGVAAAAALVDIVPVVGALVHDIPAAHRQAALDLALEVAQHFPAGSMALLRSLPAAYEEARPAAVQEWVTRGLAIAAHNAEAGVAYFGLQSRTSVRVLQASSTAATLEDVQGLVRKYVHMLSGQPAAIRPTDAFQLRSPLEEFPLEREITVPRRIDRFPTHEENARVYQFLAAHLAGRREFSTYAVTLPAGVGSLVEFLRAPEHPELLEELFLVAEGYRIAAALARAYPGLAREQRDVAAHILACHPHDVMPSQSELLDALFAALLCGGDAGRLPVWLRPVAAVVAPCVAPLADPAATADDALRVAEMLTAQLAEPGERRRQSSLDDLALDKVSGDALIDPYMDDDLPAPAGDGPQVATPPAVPPPAALPDELRLQLDQLDEDSGGATSPLPAEELQRLLEAGADLRMKQGYGEETEGLGLYITDLLGKLPPEQIEELRRMLNDATATDRPAPRRWLERRGEGAAFYYDEWDYHIGDYRQGWCRLNEVSLEGDAGEFFGRTLSDYAQLIPEVRRQFQRIRPEMYRTIKGLEDGEDFDLNAVINARIDRRAQRPASSKLYVARTREERDVATLFLIDMSASTDEPVHRPPPAYADEAAPASVAARAQPAPTPRSRRIIDITKEALVVMAEALEEIGDAYAIYGFSGHGRNNVEFYLVKSFNEALSATVKGRIGAIEPKRSTRMGTALRHATEKLGAVSSRSRHIILLSDGFPQDFDYGQDRRSNVYGLRDTTVALREAEASGITPFCITVDKAGHDYLREMCDGSRYMVIDDISALPRELPKIYQRVVTV